MTPDIWLQSISLEILRFFGQKLATISKKLANIFLFGVEGGYPFCVKRDFFRMSEPGKLLRAKKKLAKNLNLKMLF